MITRAADIDLSLPGDYFPEGNIHPITSNRWYIKYF